MPTTTAATTTTTAADRTAADIDALQLGCHLPSLQAAALLASGDTTKRGLAVVQVLPVEGGGTDFIATDGHVACWLRHPLSFLPLEGPGALGYVVQAADIPQRNLPKRQAMESEGQVAIIHRGGQALLDLGGKLQPIALHLITERAADGRRLCTGFSDWLPNVLGVWPATTEPGLPAIALNANLLGRINKAADKLASQAVRTVWKRPELGQHPILKPHNSGGSLSPVVWQLSDSEAFLQMPVQVRDWA
jgi:hypothetical protein